MDKQSILQQCTVQGCTVYLPPGPLERGLYQDVAKALNLIGGKWKGGKVMGFVFPEDPTDLLAQIANGEKRNLKKEFQFFGTPDTLADEMVQNAQIEEYDLLLEPSGGQGAIIKAIHRQHPGHIVHYCELMDVNRTFLEKIKHTSFLMPNFLKLKPPTLFHKIIANPPFSKNHDIDHINKMWDVLAPGGRIVTIASKHWLHSSNKKEKNFREWLYDEVDADVNTVSGGTFSESGTMIETVKIIINKPT